MTDIPPKPAKFIPDSRRQKAFEWIEWFVAAHNRIPTEGEIGRVSGMNAHQAKYFLRVWKREVMMPIVQQHCSTSARSDGANSPVV